MKAKIDGDNLIVTLPISKRPSKSGKTTIIASSNGNVVTDAVVDGKLVTIGVNAYIKK